jgi:hypothetical protein
MTVAGQRITNSPFPHHFKRDTIGKAPGFIQPLFVECPSLRPQIRIDKDDLNPGGVLKIIKKMWLLMVWTQDHISALAVSSRTAEVVRKRKPWFHPFLVKQISGWMEMILPVQQSNPADGIDKTTIIFHGLFFFSQPIQVMIMLLMPDLKTPVVTARDEIS